MNLKKYKPYIIGIAIVEAVGLTASLLTRSAVKAFNKNAVQPPLTPPEAVFPVVWGILYALMGISATRIWLQPESKDRSRGLNLFVIQLVMNAFWTLIFFNAAAYGAAAVWLVALWAVVLLMILQFFKADRPAAWLQVPYLLWLTFAAYLNFAVWIMNS